MITEMKNGQERSSAQKQYQLGLLHLYGNDIEQDDVRATELFCQAPEQGTRTQGRQSSGLQNKIAKKAS